LVSLVTKVYGTWGCDVKFPEVCISGRLLFAQFYYPAIARSNFWELGIIYAGEDSKCTIIYRQITLTYVIRLISKSSLK
jgi:hypothetical protein